VLTLPRRYNRPHAEKDILDGLHAARAGGRFLTSFLVGLRRYHPYPFRCMVGRLPQRLVLDDKWSVRRFYEKVINVKADAWTALCRCNEIHLPRCAYARAVQFVLLVQMPPLGAKTLLSALDRMRLISSSIVLRDNQPGGLGNLDEFLS
jgi:hypothetical protein